MIMLLTAVERFSESSGPTVLYVLHSAAYWFSAIVFATCMRCRRGVVIVAALFAVCPAAWICLPHVLTDVELILQAYLRWGDDCVQHLLGDFAFGIWDDRHQRLFCARDHFGVKPFYYSQVGDCLLFSNTIACLRQHSQVSSKLNDRTVGDVLLFDLNYDVTTTIFADIQRLPPAHTLTWSSERGFLAARARFRRAKRLARLRRFQPPN